MNKKIYLYSVWPMGNETTLRKDVGFIVGDARKPRTIFVEVGKERYVCYYKPGISYNNMIWYEEEDDQAAIDEFIKEEKKRIKDYEHRLSNVKEHLKIMEQIRANLKIRGK